MKTRWAAATCFLLVFVSIAYWRPFFGLMDDATILRELEKARDHGGGIGSFIRDFIRSDIDWGMFRPIYPLMAIALYGWSAQVPTALFLVNAALVAAILVLLGWAFTKRNAPIFLLACLAFPYTHDLFQHPSLQEKLVLLAVALNLMWLTSRRASKAPTSRWIPVTAAGLILGLSTKAQFVLFLPALICIQWRLDKSRTWALVVIGAMGTVALRWLGNQGGYTSRFGASSVLENLATPHVLLLLVVAAISAACTAWESRKRRVDLTLFLGPLTLLAFVFVFVQWGITGYLLSSAAPGVALCLISIFEVLERRQPKAALTFSVLLALLALGTTSYRGITMFGRLADIRKIVESSVVRDVTSAGQSFHMTCLEGSGSVQYYIRRYSGVPATVLHSPETRAGSTSAYWIGDSKMCPIGASDGRVVMSSAIPGGYRILERKR